MVTTVSTKSETDVTYSFYRLLRHRERTRKGTGMKMAKVLGVAAALVLLGGCGGSDEADTASAGGSGDGAAETIKLTIGAFAGPGQTAALAETATKMGIAEKHGIDLEVKYAGSIGAYYTNLANGSIDALAAGTLPAASQRIQGVPLQILNTLTTYEMTSVLSNDPEVQSLEDLKGKKLAATTAASEYQVLAITAKAQGIDLEKDVQIVNAEVGGMQALIEGGRVDAVDGWEPTLSLMQKKDSELRVVWNGAEAWKEMTGRTGRNLNFVVREDWLDENADSVQRIVDMWTEVVATIEAKPDEVDKLLQESAKIPPGMFADAQNGGRLGWEVLPAWEEEPKKDLETIFEKGLEAGFLKETPEGMIHEPAGS
jgi:ABC-type nitrate/sulfonate/bicarbonate transport system substrate-binding protein